jgi:hypothetical protein
MHVRPVAREHWTEELDSFSRQHDGWLVSLTRQNSDGRTALEARYLPLQGISPATHDASDITVTVGSADNHLTHNIVGVTGIRVELTSDRADRALVITADDGSTTTVAFRSPMRPENVDGLPGS